MVGDAPPGTLKMLQTAGFVCVRGPFERLEDAWEAARELVDHAVRPDPPVEVIGEFVLPPREGPPTRDFQTLHIDFGLPLIPGAPVDVARFTALHMTADAAPGRAATRLVSLRILFWGNPLARP